MIRTGHHAAAQTPALKPPGIDGLLAVAPTRARLPAVVRNVRYIAQVVLDPRARVQRLSEALSGDVALCTEMLRLSNAAFAGVTGRRVDTVHQAVLLLGFDRMRDVAIGAAVFAMIDRDGCDAAEGAAASVLSAHHALALATALKHPRPETAYLAGLLRNLGDLACAQWLPEAYAAYKAALRDGQAPSVAARTYLGATPDEMGRALAMHWQLPDPIRDALSPAVFGAHSGPDAALPMIARLAARVTEAIYRLPPPAEQAWASIHESADVLGLTPTAIRDVATWSFEESSGMLAALRPGLDLGTWHEKLERMVGGEVPGLTPVAPDLADGVDPSDAATRRLDVVDDLAAPADAVAAAEEATDDAIAVALAELLASGYQRAALLLPDLAAGALRVRYADGEGAEFLPQRLEVPLQKRGILAPAYEKAKDIVLPDRGAIAGADEPPLRRLRACCALWLPVQVSGIPIGVLYADTLRSAHGAGPDVPRAREARQTLGQTLDAIRRLGREAA